MVNFAHDNIETIGQDIAALVAERQALRERSASADELERNRLEICSLQRRLAHALIARHLPAHAEAA